MSSYVIAAVWLDRDDKTYFYGPYEGQEELAAGMALLSLLWGSKIDDGTVGLYQHPMSKPPWLNPPTMQVDTGYPAQRWLEARTPGNMHRQVRGFPL